MNHGIFMTPGVEEEWTISIAHTDEDVQRYLDAFEAFARDVTSGWLALSRERHGLAQLEALRHVDAVHAEQREQRFATRRASRRWSCRFRARGATIARSVAWSGVIAQERRGDDALDLDLVERQALQVLERPERRR